ncbi:MAG: hypothetical protein KAU14_01375, partial [Thermoplasmata archaeon]|nr:hypothetical protein [Thermoplasmata archaeon]
APVLVHNTTLTVKGAVFSLVVPTGLDYRIGRNYTLALEVTNIGDRTGNATVFVCIPGIIDDSNISGIDVGGNATFWFNLTIPGDLRDGNYTMTVNLAGKEYTYPVNVEGLDFDVRASLDKAVYVVDDTARLFINITNNKPAGGENMTVRVKVNGREERKDFVLAATNSLEFEIPIESPGQKKITYNVILHPGTALHISSIYVNVRADDIGLILDKQVYNIGDTVNISVDPLGSGVLNITAPAFFLEEEIFAPSNYNFTVPALTSGSYRVFYRFRNHSYSQAFEVIGYSADILSANLNQRTFNPGDNITVELLVIANTNFSGHIELWIVDPEENYEVETFDIELVEGENKLVLTHRLDSNFTGTFRLIYAIFAHHRDEGMRTIGRGDEYDTILVRGGTQCFDVIGGGVLLSLCTDKSAHKKGEPVKVAAEAAWANHSVVELYLDDELVHEWNVSTNDTVLLETIIDAPVESGLHIIRAVVKNDGTSGVMTHTFEVTNQAPSLSNSGVDPGTG